MAIKLLTSILNGHLYPFVNAGRAVTSYKRYRPRILANISTRNITKMIASTPRQLFTFYNLDMIGSII